MVCLPLNNVMNGLLSLMSFLLVGPMVQKPDKPHTQLSGFSFVIHEVHSETKSSFRVFSQRGKCSSGGSVRKFFVVMIIVICAVLCKLCKEPTILSNAPLFL